LNLEIDYNGNKGFRLLNIYERFNKGEILEKAELAEQFGVTQKTIQRDIDDLRAYIAEIHFAENEVAIKYDKIRNGYYLIHYEREWLTSEEGFKNFCSSFFNHNHRPHFNHLPNNMFCINTTLYTIKSNQVILYITT
jgi:transcriptional antiterminator